MFHGSSKHGILRLRLSQSVPFFVKPVEHLNYYGLGVLLRFWAPLISDLEYLQHNMVLSKLTAPFPHWTPWLPVQPNSCWLSNRRVRQTGEFLSHSLVSQSVSQSVTHSFIQTGPFGGGRLDTSWHLVVLTIDPGTNQSIEVEMEQSYSFCRPATTI